MPSAFTSLTDSCSTPSSSMESFKIPTDSVSASLTSRKRKAAARFWLNKSLSDNLFGEASGSIRAWSAVRGVGSTPVEAAGAPARGFAAGCVLEPELRKRSSKVCVPSMITLSAPPEEEARPLELAPSRRMLPVAPNTVAVTLLALASLRRAYSWSSALSRARLWDTRASFVIPTSPRALVGSFTHNFSSPSSISLNTEELSRASVQACLASSSAYPQRLKKAMYCRSPNNNLSEMRLTLVKDDISSINAFAKAVLPTPQRPLWPQTFVKCSPNSAGFEAANTSNVFFSSSVVAVRITPDFAFRQNL
mmetsp:Transcript_48854/g.157795  ORF Transcript_48854/g.157795 Transcript_48854/m.157795 type:complete len:307 (-) Transcript_48854:355-1275(-)